MLLSHSPVYNEALSFINTRQNRVFQHLIVNSQCRKQWMKVREACIPTPSSQKDPLVQ